MHDPRRREPLRRESFEALLAWLSPDAETAGRTYEMLRRKLIQYFERYDCSPPDVLADRALDVVARQLDEGKEIRAENPAAYCLGVARILRKEHWRSPESKEEPLENLDHLKAKSQAEQEELEQQHECLSECLAGLSGEDRHLMQEYYDDDWRTQVERRKNLAKRLGIEQVSLRARASRIREHLERCVKACVERTQK